MKTLNYRNLFLILGLIPMVPVSGEPPVSKLKSSPFSLGVELTSKYVWRGLEYGNAPVVFGTLSYDYKGLNAYVLGGYATNGSHSEVDFGLSYNYNWLTVGVSDYYFPSSSGDGDHYMNYQKNETGHSVEGYLTIAPEKIPLWWTFSTYIYGADKKENGSQAYSAYTEIGYSHAFVENHVLSLSVGTCLNKSFYTNYEEGFNVVNIALKYNTAIPIGNFRLPVSATVVYNPYVDKPLFSISLYLNTK